MKALIIGGSNGIGLAITKKLIERDCNVVILDRCEPEEGILPKGKYDYCFCDLLDLNLDMISQLAEDREISLLMITAGLYSKDCSTAGTRSLRRRHRTVI